MKKIIAVLMVTLLIFSLAACGGKTEDKTTTEAKVADNTLADKDTVYEDTIPLDILTTLYGAYSTADELYFPAGGGDMLTEETTNWEGPAKVGLEGDAVDYLTNTLHFPADSISKVNDAASLMHLMNGNIFTAGAYNAANVEDIDTLVTEIKAGIDSAQWMCGSPEKVLIAKVGDTVLACYGNTQLIDDFGAKITANYSFAEIVVNEAITA